MARARLAALLALLVAGSVLPAPAPEAQGPRLDRVVYPMTFPVAGEHSFSKDFGDPRGRSRAHEGIDILAEKLTPVVAVADGTVRWMFDERGGECCAVSIVHDDGWRSRYIHLNNDTPGTDDGRGYGIARGLREGSRVRAGQVIGYVGDSGNAEATVPHLHFELRRPDGTAVDAFASLRAAVADPRTGPPPRIAGPPVGPPADLPPEVRRPRPAPEVAPGEPAAEEGDEVAEAQPVTPFLPVPADECSAGLREEMELAEVRRPERPTLACFRFGNDEG
ncbi:MAG TPA: peptidoglycan DD-metalloendopeptidase family protein [Thermoanaerobaculia bacterium]